MRLAPTTPALGTSRNRLIRRRWAAIVAEAIVGFALFFLVLFWRRADIPLVLEAPSWIYISLGICLFSCIYLLAHGRWAAFTGVRHLATYPPAWMAALLGSGGVFLAIGLFPKLRSGFGMDDVPPTWHRLIGATCVAVVAFLGLMSGLRFWWRSRRKPSSVTTEGVASMVNTTLSSFPRLQSWLLDDSAVASAADDVFGHSRIAARIARRLEEARPPAQAVVGRLGSGKTTVRHLVEEALRNSTAGANVQLVPVELWPYENAKAAVEGVIRALIGALARDVNVIGFRGLPAAYAEAMSAAGGFWSALMRLQGVPSSPFESLRAIDETATTIGLRYVVWIEDLERFAIGEASALADERLNPIRALLYGLDQLESVTVVTATTALRMRFDIEKIARYVEELPQLPDSRVREVLGAFRTGCRDGTTVFDPADPKTRKDLDDLASVEGMDLFRAVFGSKIMDIKDSLLALCSTPRALKQALRACLGVWNRLAGEISFDDVFVLCILREAEPDAFAVIQEHIHDLRRAESFGDNGKEEAKRSWDLDLASLKMDDRTRTAIRKVVEFVFDVNRCRDNPQGMMNHNHADYWERFLSVPQLSRTERDQPVLETMLKGDDQALLDIIADDARSLAVEDFKRLLKTDRIVRLLVPLVERRSHESAENWPDHDHPPGLMPLWRMWNRRSETGELEAAIAHRELMRALDIAVPANLTLAAELEHYFVTASDQVPNIIGDAGRKEAKARLRKLMTETYTGQAANLAKALAGARPPTLLWLCWGLDRVRARATADLPFDGWAEFATTILTAGRISPRTMLPQIAGLITVEVSDIVGVRHRFDEEQAQRLFGDVPAVLRLFSTEDPTDWADVPYVEPVISAARHPSASNDGK